MFALCLVAIVGSIADVTITIALLGAGHGSEVNLLMRWAVWLGPELAYTLAVTQTAIAAGAGVILAAVYHSWTGWALLALLVLVRVGSALWNWRIYRATRP